MKSSLHQLGYLGGWLVLFLLTACTVTPTPSFPPASEPDKIPSFTRLPTEADEVTPTPPELPTRTPTVKPASTPAPTREITVATSPVVPDPTPEFIADRVLISTSPDGQWKVEALLASPTDPLALFDRLGLSLDYARLTVYQLSGAQVWTPYEEWSETGLGDSYISDLHWSADGRYLYFMHSGNADGCGTPFVTNLRRVNLVDGSLSEIPLDGLGFDVVTLSPDARLLVYRVEAGMRVYNLESGSAHIFPYTWPGNSFAHAYAWSPDGRQIAFNLNENYCDFSEDFRSSILILDLESGAIRDITGNRPRTTPLVLGWPEADQLRVDRDGVYLLDLNTGAISVDTQLPDPVATATRILQDYLNSLFWGSSGDYYTYERAAGMYGGSYETLNELNPDIDPEDRITLLFRACQVNGYQCLRLREVLSVETVAGQDGSQEFRFTVTLMNRDGSLFSRGPCCGGDADEAPQTEFVFTVRQLSDGAYQVLELPPYVP